LPELVSTVSNIDRLSSTPSRQLPWLTERQLFILDQSLAMIDFQELISKTPFQSTILTCS